MNPLICLMGNGYLRAYLGNTFSTNNRGERRQHPEFIYAANEEDMKLRLAAWRKSQRSRG